MRVDAALSRYSGGISDLGVYLHYPWCRKRCPYCDFAVEVGPPEHDAYLRAIGQELAQRAASFTGELVSIYLGGGTPSLWRPDCIAEAIAQIRQRFPSARPLEITIEANPTDCSDDNLAAWRAAGINRLSIGVQSFEPQALIVLGRDHRFGDGRAAIARALAAGFTTSADFIMGVPDAAASAVDTTPDHLSLYELTIEDRTAFGQRVRDGRLVPLPEDALTELYLAMHAQLTGAGYEHYEISSYARPGKRAVHNSLYWQGAAFLGLGVGAASLELAADGAGRRPTNPRRAADYLAAPGTPADVVESSPEEMAADRAWLALRTSDGVTEADLAPAPGLAAWLVRHELAEARNGRICPTLRGFLMADRIAARVVESWGAIVEPRG
jgi:putative oxygen-independent coproporphyrinogen III oxidase